MPFRIGHNRDTQIVGWHLNRACQVRAAVGQDRSNCRIKVGDGQGNQRFARFGHRQIDELDQRELSRPAGQGEEYLLDLRRSFAVFYSRGDRESQSGGVEPFQTCDIPDFDFRGGKRDCGHASFPPAIGR